MFHILSCEIPVLSISDSFGFPLVSLWDFLLSLHLCNHFTSILAAVFQVNPDSLSSLSVLFPVVLKENHWG